MSVSESPVRATPGGAPARSREATRRRLLAAGTALFAQHGLHGVTSARIAQRAGVATGTFYLHFKDKEALFREIVFVALAELRERQGRASRGLAAGSLAELRARTTELLSFTEDNRDLIRVVFGRGGEHARVGEDVMDAIVPELQQAFEERRARGAFPRGVDPEVAAQAHAAQLTRVVAWWAEDPSHATREQVVETLIRLHPAFNPGA